MAALVEEVAKALCVRWFVWSRPEFDERMDGITYGTRAGLGFALLENVVMGEIHEEVGPASFLLLLVPLGVLVFGGIGLRRAARTAIALDDAAAARALAVGAQPQPARVTAA